MEYVSVYSVQDELASLAAAKEACEATNQSQKEELEKLKHELSMCEEDRSHQVESLREELSTLERKHQEEREQADGADNSLRLRLEQLQVCII